MIQSFTHLQYLFNQYHSLVAPSSSTKSSPSSKLRPMTLCCWSKHNTKLTSPIRVPNLVTFSLFFFSLSSCLPSDLVFFPLLLDPPTILLPYTLLVPKPSHLPPQKCRTCRLSSTSRLPHPKSTSPAPTRNSSKSPRLHPPRLPSTRYPSVASDNVVTPKNYPTNSRPRPKWPPPRRCSKLTTAKQAVTMGFSTRQTSTTVPTDIASHFYHPRSTTVWTP